MSFSTAKRDFSMPKKTKKKKVNLGSKARRLLKHSQQKQQQQQKSASIDDDDDTKKQLEFRTKTPPPKKFVYDESEDEELKRLRAVHATNPDDDDVTMLLTQKWAPVDALSDAMIGNAEDGFVSLEVLVDVDAREDIAKTSKTTSKTLTSKESKNAEEKKKEDKEAETTTSLQQQQQQQQQSSSRRRSHVYGRSRRKQRRRLLRSTMMMPLFCVAKTYLIIIIAFINVMEKVATSKEIRALRATTCSLPPPLFLPPLAKRSNTASVQIDSDINGCANSDIDENVPAIKSSIKPSSSVLPSATELSIV